MKNKNKNYLVIFKAAFALILVLTIFGGCKKESEPAVPSSPNDAGQSAPAAAEQTTCPVMGGAINKEFFTVYKDKKVYFCCPACKPVFEKDPEKYISKLPQFQK